MKLNPFRLFFFLLVGGLIGLFLAAKISPREADLLFYNLLVAGVGDFKEGEALEGLWHVKISLDDGQVLIDSLYPHPQTFASKQVERAVKEFEIGSDGKVAESFYESVQKMDLGELDGVVVFKRDFLLQALDLVDNIDPYQEWQFPSARAFFLSIPHTSANPQEGYERQVHLVKSLCQSLAVGGKIPEYLTLLRKMEGEGFQTTLSVHEITRMYFRDLVGKPLVCEVR